MATTELLRSVPPQRHEPRAARRDRFIDVLRAGAVLAVVLQHWLMPVMSYEDGRLRTGNALATPGLWAITWFGQVMPLIFFAGGVAGMLSLQRRQKLGVRDSRSWVADRLQRLGWPVVPLALVWVPLPQLLTALDVPPDITNQGARLVGQVLWFLAIYIVIVALTPALRRLHQAWRGREIIALAASALAVDTVRFGLFDGDPAVGYLNVVLVWGAIYQIGIAYASGRFRFVAGRAAWLISAAGLAATAWMVAVGPYPSSMIGMPGAPMSNMNPPTAILVSLAVGQLGALLAIRPAIERWAQRTETARAINHLSGRLMTIYLWHVPVLVVGAGIAVVALGFDTPDPFGAAWREVMPMWLGVLTAALVVVVRAVGRFEQPRAVLRSSQYRMAVATVFIGGALLALTIVGFQTQPIAPIAVAGLGVGLALLRTDLLTGSSFSLPIRKA